MLLVLEAAAQFGCTLTRADFAYARLEGYAPKPPRLVLTFSNFFALEELEALRSHMRETFGLSWSVNLTRRELQNKRRIQAHPNFRAAVKAAEKGPAGGAKPSWRFDKCVLGRWDSPGATVWTVHSLATCDAQVVDVTEG